MMHLIVGNTGSGKTTYANQLKSNTKGILFSIDTWNNTLFIPDKKPKHSLHWFLERIERSETLILDLIHQLEQAHVDSILDLGFSKIAHRQKFRDFAQKNQYKYSMHFLDVPKAIRYKRVMQRNTEQGATFEFKVSETDFDFMESWFERPTQGELENTRIITN